MSIREIICAAAVFVMPIMTWAQSPGNGQVTRPYAILLDNGEVLWGTATRVGDSVEIRTNRDSVLLLSYKRVAHVGRTLSDLYLAQLKRLPKDQSRPAMALAEWCLQHELTSEAAEVLIRASQMPHDADRLESMQMRLQQEIIRKRFPKTDQIDSEYATSSSTGVEPNQTAQPVHLSPQAMVEFTSKIQPLILNRCGNAGCHGRGTDCDFRLQQPFNRSLITKDVTQSNAAAAARFINYASPVTSRLLQQSEKAHGGGSQSPLTLEQHSRLVEWVEMTTGKSIAPRAPDLAQLPPQAETRTASMLDASSPQADSITPTTPTAQKAAALAPESDAVTTRNHVSTASFLDPVSSQTGSDNPFDPTAYNQQYARPRQP